MIRPRVFLAGEYPALLEATTALFEGAHASSLALVHLSGLMTVGIARANILGSPEGYEFAAGLVKARLRQELRPAASRKKAPADFENDLAVLQQLVTRQPEGFAITAGSPESGTQSLVAAH